jgi:uncharacterized damage-inducible protein DinB
VTISELFLQRHDTLYGFWLAGVWSMPEELLRKRPRPDINSIAWILWHLTRAEDAGLNRFVADRPQVLDDAPWTERMNLPWRHNGGGMTSAEVDELSQRIQIEGLHDYSKAVQARTREIVAQLDVSRLEEPMTEERLRPIMFEEGLAHPKAQGLYEHYLGMTRARALMTFGLTHPFQHVGQIDIIAKLLGHSFD